MLKNHEKIFSTFFKEAERGNWKKVTIEEIAKKLKIKVSELKKIVPNKSHFLNSYNINVDKEVMRGISEEEIKISSKDEIIQEYLMHKLEIMSKYRFGIINILNVSLRDPSFLLINLKSNKDSMQKFLKKVSKNKANISQIVLIKLLLAVWLLAFSKWLYNENEKDAGFAIINKGIKRIKTNTGLFAKV